jgi:hypothetical protein
MKKFVFVMLASSLLMGCSNSNVGASNTDEKVIAGEDMDPEGGADAYAKGGDHADSPYFGHPDFYNATTNDHLTIISHFKTFQQTTEYTCGPSAILMALYNLGVTTYTERSLAIGMKCSCDIETNGLPGTANEAGEYGTSIPNMAKFLEGEKTLKIAETSYKATYANEDLIAEGADAGNLKGKFDYWAPYASGLDGNGDPIYVENATESAWVSWILSYLNKKLAITVLWGDWDGHYQDIIGYDTMGTPSIGDDMLVLADSYDTSDHLQDGYYCYPAERFYSMWVERNVVSKPYQVQQFLVLDLAK